VPLVTYFRALLLIYAALIFGELASDPATRDTLPEPLQKFQEQDWKRGLSDERAELLFVVSYTGLLFMAVSMVGLFVLWRRARVLFTLYLLSIAVSVVLSGPIVQSELTSVLSFMDTIIAGLILGMIYFSPLREYFDKRDDDPAQL
jgi:di/tricarboxylate transporter